MCIAVTQFSTLDRGGVKYSRTTNDKWSNIKIVWISKKVYLFAYLEIKLQKKSIKESKSDTIGQDLMTMVIQANYKILPTTPDLKLNNYRNPFIKIF